MTLGAKPSPHLVHGGNRFPDAINTIRRLEKQAAVFDGYSIARDRVAGSKDGIQKWIDSLGMKK